MSKQIEELKTHLQQEISRYKELKQNERQQRFERLVNILETATDDILLAGDTLLQIKEENLWKEAPTDSFHTFCESRLGFNRTWANKLCRYALVRREVGKLLYQGTTWYDRQGALPEVLETQRALDLWSKALRKKVVPKVIKRLNKQYKNNTNVVIAFADVKLAIDTELERDEDIKARIKADLEPVITVASPTTDSNEETRQLYREVQSLRKRLSVVEARWDPLVTLVRGYRGSDLSDDAVASWVESQIRNIADLGWVIS